MKKEVRRLDQLACDLLCEPSCLIGWRAAGPSCLPGRQVAQAVWLRRCVWVYVCVYEGGKNLEKQRVKMCGCWECWEGRVFMTANCEDIEGMAFQCLCVFVCVYQHVCIVAYVIVCVAGNLQVPKMPKMG